MMKNIDLTAWSHGQVTAKIWLSMALESLFANSAAQKIAFYGGWYGVAPFIILSRGILNVDSIRSFDIDPECEKIADKINTAWVYESWKFKAITANVNDLSWYEPITRWSPDIVVNTSVEHFEDDSWFYSILPKMCVAIQGNNQINDHHVSPINSLEQLKARYPMRNILLEGVKLFKYPDKEYYRYMVIGHR